MLSILSIKEIRELKHEDLCLKIEESKNELLDLRIIKSTGHHYASSQYAGLRKQVARCKTVLNERANTSSSNKHNQGVLQ